MVFWVNIIFSAHVVNPKDITNEIMLLNLRKSPIIDFITEMMLVKLPRKEILKLMYLYTILIYNIKV